MTPGLIGFIAITVSGLIVGLIVHVHSKPQTRAYAAQTFYRHTMLCVLMFIGVSILVDALSIRSDGILHTLHLCYMSIVSSSFWAKIFKSHQNPALP